MQTSFVKFRQGTLHIIGQKCYPSVRRNGDAKGRYVFLLEGGLGGGVGRGILEFFCKKVVALPHPRMDWCMTLHKYRHKNT